MGEDRPDERRLVEFGPLAGRLGSAAIGLGVVAFTGVVVQGVRHGLTFALMFRWFGLFVVAFLLVAAATAALHAVRGAARAQRRGERLSGDDVGVVPPKRPPEPDDV